jgi:dihydropteroate synthase
MRLNARGRVIAFPRTAIVMGIVNLVADSFSGDGLESAEAAVDRAGRMIGEGAEIIDVGGESARTNRPAMGVQEEIDRLAGFIDLYRRRGLSALLSINTWRTEVVRVVLPVGGELLNDISGLPDAGNAALCAETGAALLVMHTVGRPKEPHLGVQYENVLESIEAFFEAKIALAESVGVSSDQMVLDPGIDFAKQRGDNLRVFRHLDRFRRFGRPLLLPVSRKTVTGEVLGIAVPADRDAGTVGCIVAGLLRGANILRVHNVRAAVQAVKICEAASGATE